MGQYLCTGHCHLWSRLPSTMRATFLPLLLFIGEAAGASSAVHSISPTSISEGGGVIFIYGHGFSADNFNFNDPILGNKIWFYNDFETIPCATPVKKNWLLQNPQAPSTTTVVCSLPARQSKEGSTRYSMKMTVDGNEIDNAADFSVNFDEMDSKSLQNIFFGTGNCDLMDDLGHPRGVYLDVNSAGNYERDGNLTCKTSGSFIGPLNATLLVSEYGQSIIDKSALSVNSKGQAFFYHTLPEVTSVTSNTGADVGGTFLTLEGLGFDGYKDNTQVFVNDCACCKKGVGAMQCGFPMHKFCYKKSDMGCPGVCNYKYTLSGKGYPCFSDHSNTDCAWCNKNGWQCEQNAITGPDSKKGSRCQARTNQKYCASQQGDCKHIGYCDPNATCKKKANVGKFGQYWQCECNKGYTGNGIQCMDGEGNLRAQPGQQVEVTLTMTAGLYEDAPVENEFSHGDAMESLLAEMETAGGACAGDDCEATFEVTEV